MEQLRAVFPSARLPGEEEACKSQAGGQGEKRRSALVPHEDQAHDRRRQRRPESLAHSHPTQCGSGTPTQPLGQVDNGRSAKAQHGVGAAA